MPHQVTDQATSASANAAKPVAAELILEVARLKENHTRKEIAEMLNLTERQVKRYLSKYYQSQKEKIAKDFSKNLPEEWMPPQQDLKLPPAEAIRKLARELGADPELLRMEEVNYRDLTPYMKQNRVIIVFLGDVHWGSPHCVRSRVLKILEWIAKTPHVFAVIMGDLIECATRYSVGAGVYEQTMSPHLQVKEVMRLLQPIRHKILGMYIGNHEYRLTKEVGIDVMDWMCEALKVPYLGYTALNTFKVGEFEYDVAGTHGSSGSKKPHTKLSKSFDLSDIYDADVYVMAHVHEIIDATKEYRRRVGKKIEVKKRHFLITGHFLDWKGSYAEMMALTPSAIGAPYIELRGDRFHISVHGGSHS